MSPTTSSIVCPEDALITPKFTPESCLVEFWQTSMLLTILAVINSQGHQVTMVSPVPMVRSMETYLLPIVRAMNALAVVLVRNKDVIAVTAAPGSILGDHPSENVAEEEIVSDNPAIWTDPTSSKTDYPRSSEESKHGDKILWFVVTQNSSWSKPSSSLRDEWTTKPDAHYHICATGKSLWVNAKKTNCNYICHLRYRLKFTLHSQ